MMLLICLLLLVSQADATPTAIPTSIPTAHPSFYPTMIYPVAIPTAIPTAVCGGGSVYNNQTGNCDSCSVGEYSHDYATECLKCPPFRLATRNGDCYGLDPSLTHMIEGKCKCESYWIGLEASKANGIAIAMMIAYFILVVYSVKFMLTAYASISYFLALKLGFTVLLSALDTTTDLLYILSSQFADATFFGLCIFFYSINMLTYFNYLRLQKLGIVSSMIMLPATVKNMCDNNNKFVAVLITIPYYLFMLIKSIVLFFVGYCLYMSKLLMIGPIHNKFFELFTNSNQFKTTQFLDNQSFTEGVYYELVFESIPQIVLQVLNFAFLDNGSFLVRFSEDKVLIASVICSFFTVLFHMTVIIRSKCSCKNIKTGYEGLVVGNATDSKKVFSVPEVEITEFTNEVVEQVAPVAEGP